jgi:hypothetical protein
MALIVAAVIGDCDTGQTCAITAPGGFVLICRTRVPQPGPGPGMLATLLARKRGRDTRPPRSNTPHRAGPMGPGLSGTGGTDADPCLALRDLLAAGVRASVVAPEPELRRWLSWRWYWTDALVDDLVREGRLRRMDGQVMMAGRGQPDGEQEHPVTSEDSG